MTVANALSQLQAALAARYTIERELGRGGWATVYLAHDIKHDRRVAIKVLRPDIAQAVGPGRFLREIAIAGKLTHPNILALHDSGRAGDSLYYVMPYIQGETLRQRLLRESQLPVPAVLAIARQVAEALSFAHGQNVVHRDIKPENILLEREHVYVADFGIARAVEVAAGETLSSPGLAVGTPAYMSPEQATGSANLDGRSDVYSLGCVVYEMLTGEPPHTGSTAHAIIARQQSESPRSIRVVRPSVPTDVERSVYKALAKPAADRYQSVAEFSAALAAARQDRTELPPSLRAAPILAAVAFILALGGTIWLARKAPPRPPPVRETPAADATHVAVLYFDDLSEKGSLRAVAGGLTEDLIDELGQVTALHVISPNGVRPFARQPAPPDSIGRALRVGTLVGGSVERSGDALRVTVRLIDAANGVQLQSRTLEYPFGDLFALQDQLTQEVSRFLRERLGQEILLRERRKGTNSVAAWELVQEGDDAREAAKTLDTGGDAKAAARALDAADSLFTSAGDLDVTWPDAVVLRGWVAVDRMQLFDRALDSVGRWYGQGMKHADRALQLHPGDPSALELRGTLTYQNWLAFGSDPAELRRAEEDLRAGAVATNSARARAWGTLSKVLQATGQLAEANLLAHRAYEADAFLTESDDLLFRLYYTSRDLGKQAEAVRWCETGLQRFPQDWHFTYCQLSILAEPDSTRASDPEADIAKAWQLLGQLERISPPEERAYLPRWQIEVAGIIGQAGLRDSAEAVIRRARTAAPDDREMDFQEAVARMAMGDREGTLRLLARDIENNPRFRQYVRASPAFRPLWDDPRFQALVSDSVRNSP
jgi:eukaryotic-like serine/threonine-protein kinase